MDIEAIRNAFQEFRAAVPENIENTESIAIDAAKVKAVSITIGQLTSAPLGLVQYARLLENGEDPDELIFWIQEELKFVERVNSTMESMIKDQQQHKKH